MVATAIYSVTMVLWKETAFPLCRAMERRWNCQCYYYYYYKFLEPGTQFPRTEKITLCNTKKVHKSSWNEPYSSSSFLIIITTIISFLTPVLKSQYYFRSVVCVVLFESSGPDPTTKYDSDSLSSL